MTGYQLEGTICLLLAGITLFAVLAGLERKTPGISLIAIMFVAAYLFFRVLG